MSINFIIIILAVMAIAGIGFCIYLYIRNRTLEEIRIDVYKLFLNAEHLFFESPSGQQKMKYVISRARGLLPKWLRLLVTDELLEKIIEGWFRAVKDLLDDGKLNEIKEKEDER